MASLKTVTLNAARSKRFPEGSIRHGYVFVAPLDPEGRIDVEAWKAHRGECFARRFWGDDEPRHGLLVHRAGGHGGSTWRFELGAGPVLDEEDYGFRFGDHVLALGEYVSIRDEDGELTTFKVIGVK
jgi:hypothetical protein